MRLGFVDVEEIRHGTPGLSPGLSLFGRKLTKSPTKSAEMGGGEGPNRPFDRGKTEWFNLLMDHVLSRLWYRVSEPG